MHVAQHSDDAPNISTIHYWWSIRLGTLSRTAAATRDNLARLAVCVGLALEASSWLAHTRLAILARLADAVRVGLARVLLAVRCLADTGHVVIAARCGVTHVGYIGTGWRVYKCSTVVVATSNARFLPPMTMR